MASFLLNDVGCTRTGRLPLTFLITLLFALPARSFAIGYSISRAADPSYCTTTFPTSYSTINFSLNEIKLGGKNGITRNQSNVILTLGFSASNFSFNPGVGNIGVTGTEITINGYTITARNIIIDLSSANSTQQFNVLSFTGFQVRATAAATVDIVRVSAGGGITQTCKIDGASNKPANTVSWGRLTVNTPYNISSNVTSQGPATNVYAGSTDNQIIHVQVVVAGSCGSALTATSFNFNTTGSGLATQNPTLNLLNAKLYYTGLSAIFSSAALFGSVNSPNGAFAITGSQIFAAAGTYNFWLTYDISSSPNNGELIDAAFSSMVISGSTISAVSGNPSGSRVINNNVYYSLNNNVWSNNTTKWSLTSAGPACSCVPTASAAVFISHATQLDINSPSLGRVTIQSGGVLTDNNRLLTVTDALVTTGTGYFQATNAWSLNDVTTSGSGASTTNKALSLTGDLNIGAGTTVALTGGNANNLNVDGNIFIDGVLSLGTSNGTSSNANGTSISGIGSVTGSGVITLGVSKTILSGSSLTIAPSISISSGVDITNMGTVTVQSNITGGNSTTSRWINEVSSVLNMAGTTSALLSTGRLVASADYNTVNYSGSGNQTIKIPLNSTYYHLYSSNAGTKAAAAALTIYGDIGIADAAQFSAGANAITVNGNWNNYSTNGTPFSSTGTVFFNGNDTINGIGITSFNIVDITSSANLVSNSLTGKVVVTGNFQNDGNFEHNSSDVTFNGTSTILGTSTTEFYNATVNNAKTLTLHSSETDFAGSLTVNGTIAHNSGLAVFTGNGNVQALSGAAAVTLYQLEISNAGGSVNLSTPVAVNNSLTLTDGLFVTTSTNSLALIAGAASSPGNAGSFVSGPMFKTGTTAFLFPVGKGSQWARIGIGAPSASSTFRAEYFDNGYASTAVASSPTPALNHVSTVEYWVLDRTSGTGNAAVTLYWENASRSGIIDCSNSDLRIAHWNGSAWENNNEGVVTSGSCTGSTPGSITTTAVVTAFSPFTFGSKSSFSLNPLPIELAAFSASCSGDHFTLNWSTRSELNNARFIVERTRDGVIWEEMVSVPGAGTSHQTHNYSYEGVPASEWGIYYYKLVQEDKNGQRKEFKIIDLLCSAAPENKITLFPNPATNAVNVVVSSDKDLTQARLTLVDNFGRIILGQEVNLAKGATTIPISFDLSPGIYSVLVYHPEFSVGGTKLMVRSK